jgi:hypothetical protein
MKTKLLFTAFVSSLILHHSAFGQGALTPPGAPAPTMKSLDQVEARTAITNTASTATISQPGSYYLTGNLTVSTGNGVTITTNGVTLDLNGFTIRSTVAIASGNGISISSGLSDITIRNGHIRGGVTNNGSGVYSGGGFNNGIFYSSIQPVNVLVSRLSVSSCSGVGIFLGTSDATVVEACTVRTVGTTGIAASTVKSCSAVDCGTIAINGDQVSDSRGESTGSSTGLNAVMAQNCYGSSNSGFGLVASSALNCTGLSVSNYGLSSSGSASGCRGYSTSGTGLNAFIANCCTGSSLSVTHNLNSF